MVEASAEHGAPGALLLSGRESMLRVALPKGTTMIRRFGLACFCGGLLLAAPATGEEPEKNTITHGPILGRLSAHGVGVWARTRRPGKLAVQYGVDAGNLDRRSEAVRTRLADDNTGWVHLTGLHANMTYHYKVVLPGYTERTGRSGTFTTLPDRKAYKHPKRNPKGLFNFSFEFACGNNQNPAHSVGPALPTFRTMLEEIRDEIHFAILNGDWLYEARRRYTPEQWLAQVGRPGGELPRALEIAPTLAGVWENYKHFLEEGEPLARWHRHVPTFFTYDDHEILNDVWGAGTPGLRDRRAVFRDIGVRAWYDYLAWSNPTEFTEPVHFGKARLKKGNDVLVDPNADFTKMDLSQHNNLHVHWGTKTAGVNDNALDGVGGDPNAGVYEIVEVLGPHRMKIAPAADADGKASYSIGRRAYYRRRIANCEFFFLDTRGQREMHDTDRPAQEGLSMLGDAQRKWLMDGVKNSDAEFVFVVSSVNFMIPHVGGGKVRASNKDDAWTVFLDEREKLIDFWDGLEKPVFVLSGDLHNSFAIRITDNVYEFASGPHNSNNHRAEDEGNRPPNGRFKYGPRSCEILWSTYYGNDIPREALLHPTYCVVQVNNVFNNPKEIGGQRWVAYPRPQVIFRYYDGRTGRLEFAKSVLAPPEEN